MKPQEELVWACFRTFAADPAAAVSTLTTSERPHDRRSSLASLIATDSQAPSVFRGRHSVLSSEDLGEMAGARIADLETDVEDTDFGLSQQPPRLGVSQPRQILRGRDTDRLFELPRKVELAHADFGGKFSVEAARMAAEDFGGKVLDAPVEIITADHQNKPDIASNIARQWYDTEQVDAIMELTTSSVALAVQALSAEKKKIDLVTGAATADLTIRWRR